MATASAIGPKTSMPIGIMELLIIPNTPNTRPVKSLSTRSWRSTVEGVLNEGKAKPKMDIKAR
ncbi:hypothetical protein D3C87_1880880 [compost metagenome]